MMWFKRWYHERFVSHTSKNNETNSGSNIELSAGAKRKVIRIIYDSCDDGDDSISRGHRRNHSQWLIQRQLIRRSIDSFAATGIDINRNENNNFNAHHTAIEATELVQTIKGKKIQVIDNDSIEQTTPIIVADNVVAAEEHSTDIDDDVISELFMHDSGSREEIQSAPANSFVTDVNKYGNGEKSGLLSKPKDPRLRTFALSIVPKINCNFCNQNHHTSIDVNSCFSNDDSISNRIQIQYDDDEWPPKSLQQIDFVQRHIKELEYFISEIENRVESNSGSRSESISSSISSSISNNSCNSITSFDDDTNRSYTTECHCNEQSLNDWVVVSIELRSITTCENLSSDDNLIGKESSSSTPSASPTYVQYYTTSEICDKRTIITVHPFQSNCTLNDRKSSSQLDYGHNCTGQLLCICKLLDFNNIQTGTPSSVDHQHHRHHHQFATEVASTSSCHHQQPSDSSSMKFTSISTTLARDFHSTDSFFRKDPMYPEFNYLLQEPCTSSKHSNMLTAQMIHASLSSISSSIDSPKLLSPFMQSSIKCCSTESIPEYFGLNECGDIIIHIDHICEETGFGFLAGRKKKIYCDVPYGEEVYEKPKFSLKYAVKRFFKTMSDTIGKCTSVGELKQKNYASIFSAFFAHQMHPFQQFFHKRGITKAVKKEVEFEKEKKRIERNIISVALNENRVKIE